MYFQGISFILLLTISFAIPVGIILAGIEGRLDWFFSLSLVIIGYDILQGVFILGFAGRAMRCPHLQPKPSAPPSIAVVVPTWNEEVALPKMLATVLEQDDRPDAIIVSDDGSTDKTLAMLSALYGIDTAGMIRKSPNYPNLWVLCKEHSGKGDSINQAVALSDADIVLILDADTRLYPGSIRALRDTFTQYPYLDVVTGTLIPFCSKSGLGRAFQFFQRYEYARTHLWRLAWSYLDSTLIVSGACSAFRRQTLMAIGGFYPGSWVEDYEIMYRLQRYRRQRNERCPVMVQPNVRVQTEAPETIYDFLRQRRRWAGGFLETITLYRQMVGNPRYGILGCVYLVHNAFSVAHPFYNLTWLVAGLALMINGVHVAGELFWLVLMAALVGAIVVSLSIRLYRRYFHRQDVVPLGAVIELALRPFFYLPLNFVSHVWGYTSYLTRKKSW